MVGYPTSTYLLFGPTTFETGNTVLHTYSITFSPTTIGGDTQVVVGLPGDFALEGAGSPGSMANGVYLVLRDRATNEGYIYTTMTTPTSNINPDNLFPMGQIVPGTVRFSADGLPIAETMDGHLCEFNSDGSQNNSTDSVNLNDYVVAYGMSDAMYLFNPSSGELLKTLAWWRNP